MKYSSLESPEWAGNYVVNDADLWSPRALLFLKAVRDDPEVEEALNEVRALHRGIDLEQDPEKRRAIINRYHSRVKKVLPPEAIPRVLERVTASLFTKREGIKKVRRQAHER